MTTTREKLIDAATHLLDRGGPEDVTLREVGRLSGVSHNAPYRHFSDKRALLAAVAARELAAIAGEYRKAATGERNIRDVVQAYTRRALTFPERFRLMYSDAIQHNAEIEQASRDVRSAILEAVAAAQGSGQLPQGDADKLAWLLRACAYGATIRALANPGHWDKGDPIQPEALIAELFCHLGAKD